MIAWFVAIGACGVNGIVDNPEILKRLSRLCTDILGGHFHIAFFSLARSCCPSPVLRPVCRHGSLRRGPSRTDGSARASACTLSYFGQGRWYSPTKHGERAVLLLT